MFSTDGTRPETADGLATARSKTRSGAISGTSGSPAGISAAKSFALVSAAMEAAFAQRISAQRSRPTSPSSEIKRELDCVGQLLVANAIRSTDNRPQNVTLSDPIYEAQASERRALNERQRQLKALLEATRR